MTERPAAGPASAGRVIAGTARSIRLVAPGAGTRPLGDRVKQALFAILEPELRRGPFLDLCAGSGAAGIEALSRGAPGATFVERDARAVATIRANLDRTRLAGPSAQVLRRDALEWLRATAPEVPASGTSGGFHVALVDPPYDQPDLLVAALDQLGRAATPMDPGAVVVAKHHSRVTSDARIGLLRSTRTRQFGDTSLTFYRLEQATEDAT